MGIGGEGSDLQEDCGRMPRGGGSFETSKGGSGISF